MLEKEERIEDYAGKLKSYILELRSKLTTLMLVVEGNSAFSTDQKECILRVCRVINNKNNELLFAEEQLSQIINIFGEGPKPEKILQPGLESDSFFTRAPGQENTKKLKMEYLKPKEKMKETSTNGQTPRPT